MTVENKGEASKDIRHFGSEGKIMHAIDSYKNGQASIGKAAEIAEVSVSEMMDILVEFGVKSNITYEDYLEGLKYARKLF